MTVEERGLSDIVWTPERGLRESPEIRSIAWNNFLLSDEPYMGRSRTAAEIRITPDTALASTVVLACCRILAETISTLPLNVMRRTPGGGSEIANIPLQKVLSFAPNEWQTKFEFFEQVVMFLTLWGNSYTLIRSGRYGAVSALDNLHPSRMDVERIENGRLRYLYTNPETGRLERYTQDQIMHIRWTAEPDGIKGMVPVEVAREAIALARACEIHASKYWANNARPGVVLQTDHSLSPESAERLRDNWEALHRGSDRSHRTAVLTNGLKIEPIGFNPEQSQAIDSRRFQSEEIARVYRLPLHLVQGQSGGDNETSGQEFVTYTLMPWLKRIEGAISRSLIYNDDAFFAEFDTRALMRANSNARAGFYSTMTNLGIYSINDCRRAEGLTPIEHGDKHFVAMNMMPLEEAVKQKQPQEPPPGGPPPEMPGGVPSLPGVLNGKAPPESPKGTPSEKKPENTKAEGDATEKRDDCGRDPSGRFGEKNDCASGDGSSSPTATQPRAPKRDRTWASSDGYYGKSGEDMAKKSPITGGETLEKFEIDNVPEFLESMNDIGIGGPSSLDKVVTVGGGTRAGGKVQVWGSGDAVHVASNLPLASDGSDSSGTAFIEISIWDNDNGGFNVTYENFFPSPPRDVESGSKDYFNREQVTSLMMQKMLESMSTAEKMGADSLETFAAGRKTYSLKGYRLWPQFGFDGPLGEDSLKKIAKEKSLPDDVRQKAKDYTLTIQELIASREGQTWWDDNGSGINLSLNLKDKSSLGYKRYKRMSKLLPRLKSRNESRSVDEWIAEFRDFFASEESEQRDCGRESDGKFGPKNNCQENAGEGETGKVSGKAGSSGASQVGGREAGSPPKPVSPFDVEKLLEKISQSPDGFTLDPASAEQPDSGIMVSEFANDSRRSVKIPANSLRTDSGRSSFSLWLADNVDVLIGQEGSRYIGGWSTGDDFYIDVATRFESGEDALEAGRKAGQLAVFNLGTFKETWVKYDEGDKRKPKEWDSAYARARKDSTIKQVYDPDSPAMIDEDHADELAKTGKKTVRSYDCQDTETGAEHGRHREAIRHSDISPEGDRRLSGVSGIRREEGEGGGRDSRSVVVRGLSDSAAAPVCGSAGGPGESVHEGHRAPGQEDSGSSPRPCGELIADAAARAGVPVEDFVVRDIGPALAAFDQASGVVIVSPDAGYLEDDGWSSQPNPVLREAAMRMYSLASPESFARASAVVFSQEQRDLIAANVSRLAAESGADLVAEVLAGEMCDQMYGHDIYSLVSFVVRGEPAQ